MARLPTLWNAASGSQDNNNWGTILNEFLAVSLDTSGALKTTLTPTFAGLTLTGSLLLADGTAAAPPIAREAQPGTGIQFESSSIRFWGTGAIPLGRFVTGPTWSNDIPGIGLRLDEGGGTNSILSMRAATTSTIRYDGEQIEIVLGANNNATVAIVPIGSGFTTGASFDLRNAPDTDGLHFEYLNNTTPLITVTGSLVADRNLTVRPKNATSIPWVVQGAASQSANLQNWIDSAGTILAAISASGRVGILTPPAAQIALNIGPTLAAVTAQETRIVNLAGSAAAAVDQNAQALRIAPEFVEAASGNHTLLSAVTIQPGSVTAGGATVSDTAALYIAGVVNAVVSGKQYALWVDSGLVRLDMTTQATVGAAGGASALPATPTGYAVLDIGGTEYIMPYYAKS